MVAQESMVSTVDTVGPAQPLLEVRQLSKSFPISLGFRKRGSVSAVDDVSIGVETGTTMGCVGESGCGKSPLARLILDLVQADGVGVLGEGKGIRTASQKSLPRRERKAISRNMQMVFQDPYSSLNPRNSVGEIIGFPMSVHGSGRDEMRERTATLLTQVGLHRNHASYYPHQLSGGQQQMVALGRALMSEARLLMIDELSLGLAPMVVEEIFSVIRRLQDEKKLTVLLVAQNAAFALDIADYGYVLELHLIHT